MCTLRTNPEICVRLYILRKDERNEAKSYTTSFFLDAKDTRAEHDGLTWLVRRFCQPCWFCRRNSKRRVPSKDVDVAFSRFSRCRDGNNSGASALNC
jgi:hypothetical protein